MGIENTKKEPATHDDSNWNVQIWGINSKIDEVENEISNLEDKVAKEKYPSEEKKKKEF